jgi:regulator of CtrA degradation
MSETELSSPQPVVLAERLLGTEAFAQLFKEGMSLVESTAAYLDGPGRQESRSLDRAASLAYATESMRLTTRLMQLASWLLLQRAVNDGELTTEQAKSEKNKVRFSGAAAPEDDLMSQLPERLRELIGCSISLQDKVVRLDSMLYSDRRELPPVDNPVERQLGLLKAAFERPA